MSVPSSRGGANFVHPGHPNVHQVTPPPARQYVPFMTRRLKWFGKYAAWTPALAIVGGWFIWPALSDQFRATVVPGYAARHGIKLDGDEAADGEKDDKKKDDKKDDNKEKK